MAQKVYDSCVMKRDWRYYKTCNECTIKDSCTERLNWHKRVIESVMVWYYRKRINGKLKRMFIGVSGRQIKNAKRAFKEEQRRDQERAERARQELIAKQDRDIELDGKE